MGLGANELLVAYRTMRTIREFENYISVEFEAGRIPGFTHLYLGQEAVATGVCMHLNEKDYIASTHRGHGHCIAKGCDVKRMALEIFCKQGGLCKGKGGSMHIADVSKGMLGANAIVGGGAPLALGAALTVRTLDSGNVSVAFLGDGASNQGTVFESMNFALVLKLPMIFVFENNGYGEHTGISYHLGAESIAVRNEGFGIPTITVDGTDLFSVYDAMSEAVEHARTGNGPFAIEAIASRWRGHFEGDPQAYRNPDEVKQLRNLNDPIVLFAEQVLSGGQVSREELGAIDDEVSILVDTAMKAAKVAPVPVADELLSDVYVTY